MRIIEKIEIKYFRSFGVKTSISDLRNLNIFSGGNDSGKSNILRALNLFFNYNKPDFICNIDEDFSEIEKNRQKNFKKKTIIIEITVYFFSETKNTEANRSDKFAVRRFFDINGYRGQKYILVKESDNSFFQKIEKELNEKDLGLKKYVSVVGDSRLEIDASNTDFVGIGETQISKTKKSVTNTVNRIEYYYIPAIRTPDFFQKMIKKYISRIQESFDKNGRNNLSDKMAEVEDSIRNYSKIFFGQVPFLGSDPKFKIPDDLSSFFSQFDIGTGENNTISFRNRGDGIQAHLVPEFLHFLSSEINNNGELGKPIGKYFIWAFEEPENSCEYSKTQEISELFIKYSDNKEHNQIFITSHAFNFLGLSGKDVCLYRVFKDGKNSAVFGPIPEDNDKQQLSIWKYKHIEKEKLEQEIGVPKLMKKMFENWKMELEEKKILKQEKERLSLEISKKSKPFLCVEDEYDQIYKIAWLKLNDIECNENNFADLFDTHNDKFAIIRTKSANELYKIIDLDSIDLWQGRNIVGLFDFDSAYNQFNSLKTSKIQDKRWNEINGTEGEGLYKKRHDGNIYALLLPVPSHRTSYASLKLAGDSRLQVELYFTDDILLNLKNLGEENLSGVTEKRIIFTGKKTDFWKKLFALQKNDFINFNLLFIKVNELLK